jgi:hypothetical protein
MQQQTHRVGHKCTATGELVNPLEQRHRDRTGVDEAYRLLLPPQADQFPRIDGGGVEQVAERPAGTLKTMEMPMVVQGESVAQRPYVGQKRTRDEHAKGDG